MKKSNFLFSTAILALVLIFAGCSKDEENPPTQPTSNNVVKSGLLNASQTWSADSIYELAGKVVVSSGVVLTIEPGTLIKGRLGEGSLASALIVAQGGKLQAIGTAAKPIIMTSTEDNIQIGQIAGTNLDEEDRGLWGGLIICGSAKISGDADTLQIEGIPADDTYGRYGGQNDADNSGTLDYISIRHGGTLIGEGNEINGLTLGGVGSGTSISNIEIVANKDDGIEPFGGTVNVTNALVWAQGDDAFDIDQAYSGTFDNIIYVGGPESDHGLEIDGPEGALTGKFKIKNGSFKGFDGPKEGEYADFRDGAMGTVENVFWWNFTDASDVELDDSLSSVNYGNNDLIFNNWEIVSTKTVADIFQDKSGQNPLPSGWIGTVTPKVTIMPNNTNKTVGADPSAFNWTYAFMKGALDDF